MLVGQILRFQFMKQAITYKQTTTVYTDYEAPGVYIFMFFSNGNKF